MLKSFNRASYNNLNKSATDEDAVNILVKDVGSKLAKDSTH